jgi:predicted ATPase
MIPTTLGHYKLQDRIGHGGMGEVFRAFDTRLNRPVAVKVMRAAVDAGSLSLDRFLREARAASALNHPNIVIIHEVGSTPGGDHFIVQELIDGKTLRSMLTPGTPLPLATMFDIGRQVARALAAAHGAGIVHRDVKPENIMIRPDGFVKVLDFGLARPVETTTSAQIDTRMMTTPGTLLGTPAYMSPEQGNGGTLGPAVDVFALGVVIYEMAAGRRPFAGATALAVIASIISDQPVPLSRVNPEVPRAIDDLILRMLHKEADCRPAAFEIERELAAAHTGTIALPVRTPIPLARRATVGRDLERTQLLRAYSRAKDGRSLIVAVTGEPGIGKTSLVEDFLGDLGGRGERPIVARGRCSESLAGSEAYLPVLEVLDSLIHRTDGQSLATLVKTIAPTWYTQVATASADGSVAGELRESLPAASPERMKREFGVLLQEVSRVQPVVLCIEDLHWADVSTIDILNYVAGRFAELRVLLLTSYRPSDMTLAKHPFLAVVQDLQSRALFEEIPLAFLEPRDVAWYLALQFPANQFPPDFAAAIHAKTEGSPLFMVDLVRYLRDTGGLVEENGFWRLARSMPDVPRDLPESVRGMIARKIERVPEADRRLLLAASVQGHEFDSTTVAEATGIDPGEVEDRLEALERVHVFVRRGDEHEFPDRTLTLRYTFVHVLYQNVLFASLQPTRRVALSRSLAASLVQHHGTETTAIAGRLAVLFETAREFASSAQYFFVAAQRAVTLFGFREALSLAGRGLEGLRTLPDGPERQQLELGLQMIRGLALRSVKGWAAPELESTFARARQLCHQLDDPPELFPVLWNLTFFSMIRGDLEVVRGQTSTLMAQAEASGNPAYLMAVHHVAGVSAEFTGDIVESSRLLERARELHDPARHKAYTATFGVDPGMVARAMSSRPLWSLGFVDRAVERANETIALGRSQRQPVTLVFALIVAQGIHLYRGEAQQAIALGDEIVSLCQEYEFPQEAEWARGFRASATAALGKVDEGIAQLHASLAALHALRSGLTRTMFLSLLADALRRAGQIAEGLAVVEEGFTHAELTFERGFLAELHRVCGDLLLASGDARGAEASFRQAIAVAAARQARSFELRAATGLARLLGDAGRRDEAVAVLSPIYDWFTEGHGTADLVSARTLLSGIGAPK